MAQSTQTIRVIIAPITFDIGAVQNLFTLPALIQAAQNGWFSAFYSNIHYGGDMVLPSPNPSVEKVIRVELVTTPTNDANLVSTSLPALQADLGLSSPIPTWSYTAEFGY